MFARPQYKRPYQASAGGVLRKRKELHERRGQHFAITLAPKTGEKVPFIVKFPRSTSFFRKVPIELPYSYLRNQSEGLFNGLFYVSANYEADFDIHQPGIVPSPPPPPGLEKSDYVPTRTQEQASADLMREVFSHPRYTMISEAYKRVQQNLRVNREGVITELKLDKRQSFDSDTLKQQGKYCKL